MSIAPGARTRRPVPVLPLVAVALVVLVAGVAAAVLTGRMPGFGGSADAALTLRSGAPPLLDCGDGATDGGVVRGAPAVGADGLAAAVTAEKESAPSAEVLVRVVGYRAGDDVVAVWSDAAGRARLVLTYRSAGDGWVLASRSGCV